MTSMGTAWLVFLFICCITGHLANSTVINSDGQPEPKVVLFDSEQTDALMKCTVDQSAVFETLTWMISGDALCTVTKATDATCKPATGFATKYKIHESVKYNLHTFTAPTKVTYDYGGEYMCQVTFAEADGTTPPNEEPKAFLTVVDETKCPEPTIDANKDDVIKLNCTVGYSGKEPTLSIKPTTGDALETTVMSIDTDNHKTAQGTATHKFTEAGDFNYTCTTSFDGVTYVDKAPCLMTVTVKGPDTPDDNAAVGLKAPIYLLVGAVTFWLTRMV